MSENNIDANKIDNASVTTTDTTTTFKYDVETASLMSTIINSVYSSKDYAIRELISNASDACDRLSYAYNDLKSFGLTSMQDLRVSIHANDGYVVIEDNGIGMTKADLVNCIGTIASSGTKKFKEALKQQKVEGKEFNAIGQFGLGFYSAFLIADQVKVITRHPSDKTYVWESKSLNEYSITEAEEEREHGTQIILKIKPGEEKYAEIKTIEDLVKKYSMFTLYPIYITKEVEEEVKEDGTDEADPEKVEEEQDENKVEEVNEDDEMKVEEVKQEKKPNKIKVAKPVLINKSKPLWLKSPSKVTDEEYNEFYKTLSNDWDTFLASKHVTLEGHINLTLLLFIPKRSQKNMFEKGKKDNFKVYVQNVFVTDDLKDALPEWMSFVVGVVSSDDAPMNISRETFQGSNTMKMLKKNLSKKVIEIIEDISADKEKYDSFLKEYSVNLKMAVRDTTGTQQDKVARLLRFHTTKSGEEKISLDEYVDRNKEETTIYVITGLSKEEVTGSPFLKLYQDKEVVFMYEPVDEIMLQGFSKFDNRDIKRITSEGTMDKGKVNEDTEKLYADFLKDYKDLLSSQVEKINLRDISDAPCVISTTAYSYSAAMENIIRSQPGSESNPFLAMMGRSKKVFEINPENPIIQNIRNMHHEKNESWKDYGKLLYETALIECGYKIENNINYANQVYNFLSGKSSNTCTDEKIEECHEEPDKKFAEDNDEPL